MPKTRPKVSRDEKMGEILALARRRLRDGGYQALSVAAIARELGVAQNAVYWYFPSKDHLFVAALEAMLTEIAARKPSKEEADEIERILWFTDQLQELSELRGAMRERARSSDVAAEFIERLDTVLSQMLSNTLRARVPPDELPLAVEAFRATVDGTVVKGLDRDERRPLLRFALERLIGGG